MIRRYAQVLLLTGGLAAGGVVAVAAGAGANSAAGNAAAATKQVVTTMPASQKTVASTTTGTNSTSTAATPSIGKRVGFGRGGHGGFGNFGGPEGFGGFGGPGLTVTSISGNTITANEHGMTVTVQVSATTVYTQANATASLADIQAGSRIAVRTATPTSPTNPGSTPNTTPTAIVATGITIILPRESGVVTNVAGSSLTLTDFNGTARTVALTSSTRYQKAGQNAALSDLASGTAVDVQGTTNSDGSLTAVLVTIRLPQVHGTISAVNGSAYSLTGRAGSTVTVNTTGSTTYVNADGSTATAAALKSGVSIAAEGTLSSDNKTLTALRVTIMPPNGGRGPGGDGGPGSDGGFGGPGGPGGFGGGHGGFDDGNGTTIAPSSTPALTPPGTTGTTGTTTSGTGNI